MANPAVRLLLRSPLHPLLSKSTLLITVTGRKSGRRYTTPVNYHRDGDCITIFSRKGRSWWRNLRDGGPVVARVRGADLQGEGRVLDAGEAEIAGALRAVRPQLSPERAAHYARDMVMVRIDLEAGS